MKEPNKVRKTIEDFLYSRKKADDQIKFIEFVVLTERISRHQKMEENKLKLFLQLAKVSSCK